MPNRADRRLSHRWWHIAYPTISISFSIASSSIRADHQCLRHRQKPFESDRIPFLTRNPFLCRTGSRHTQKRTGLYEKRCWREALSVVISHLLVLPPRSSLTSQAPAFVRRCGASLFLQLNTPQCQYAMNYLIRELTNLIRYVLYTSIRCELIIALRL